MTFARTSSAAWRLIPALALASLMAACSTPGTRLVLLPQEDGTPSAVVMRAKGGEQVLSQPYQQASALQGSTQPPRLDTVDPVKLRAENSSLFELAPPAPQLYTLYFDQGGTVLTSESQQMLPQVLSSATSRAGGDIVVIGHSDTQGAADRNDELSLRRAEEIRQMLLQRGFPAHRIEAAGRGERDLAVPTADEVSEPKNRRVTVEVR